MDALSEVLRLAQFHATVTLDATGTFEIGVGGTFAIGANQANGLYTAQFQVTAEYL